MSLQHVLIVGASRGLGLGLVREFLQHGGYQVHATVRQSPSEPPADLAELQSDKLTLHQLDVTSDEHLATLSEALADTPLDVLVYNSGIYRGHADDEIMHVNAVRPFAVVDALLPRVEASATKKLVLMSSILGSRHHTPDMDGYGKSKAALNDEFRKRHADWEAKGITSIVMHPGWVSTDMGGAKAPVTPSESCAGMFKVIHNLEAKDTGKFFTYQGRELKW